MGIRGGSVLVPWRPFFWIAAEVVAANRRSTTCMCLHVLFGRVPSGGVLFRRGPFQRRLQEIGGITPLVFGQYGELSESFEGLIDTLAVKGCDQAADHYLLDVGPGAASVQKRLLRQRVNCCVARAQAAASGKALTWYLYAGGLSRCPASPAPPGEAGAGASW